MSPRRPLTRKIATSLAAILILAAGCAEQSPTSVELAPGTFSAARGGHGRIKAKVAHAQHHAGSYARVIGPKGGKLRFGIGVLDVPRGALDRPVRLTATTDGSALSVTFGPHGTRFNAGHEPTLTFDVKGYDGDLSALQIVYVDDADNVLEEVTSFSDVGGRKVSGNIAHFSRFVLASN